MTPPAAARHRNGVSGGRPRDPEISRAILDATLDALARDGYARVTVEHVAQQAGVHKPAVYRRWPTKVDLVVAAVSSIAPAVRDPQTGAVRDDLVALLTDSVASKRGRYGIVAMRLRADLTHDRELSAAVERTILRPRRAVARAVLERGVATGELRRNLDVDLAIDLLYGALSSMTLLGHRRITRSRIVELVDLALVGLRAPAR